MSKVVFTSLDIHNFSIITSVYIPLNIPGITIIDGPIGTGKSSILEAFYFCISGDFFETSSTFKSVMNRFTKKPMKLTLTGRKGDIPFVIYRTMKLKSPKSPEIKHILEFYVNGESLHAKVSSTTQIQNAILEFLDIDPLLLFNSKIFGQGDISSFTKVNDRKKKIILDKLVGLGICDKAYKIATTMLTDVNTTLTSLDIELSTLSIRVKELTTEIEDLISKQKDWNNLPVDDNKSSKDKITAIQEEIKHHQIKISELSSAKKELVISLQDSESIKEKIGKLKTFLPPVTKKIEIANTTRIDIDRKKNFVIGKLSTLVTDIKRLEQFLNAGKSTKCPTCYSIIDPEVIEKALQEFKNNKNKIDITIEVYKTEIENAEQEHNKWTKQKNEIDKAVTSLNSKLLTIQNLEMTINEISKRIETHNKNIKDKKAVIELLQEPVNSSPKTCPYTELIANKSQELEEKIKIVDEKREKMTQLETRKQYLTILAKAFNNSGIPQLISKDVLKVLNMLMGNYKNRLLGEDFYLQFKTRLARDNEEIYPDVVNPCGGEGYYRQSKGEKRKIDLCQMFALSDFAKMQGKCDINLMLFDEVFSELNHSESEAVLEVIKEYPVTSKLIISHKDLFKEEYSNVIKMRKEGNLSIADVNIVGWDGSKEVTNDKSPTVKTETP
jgi:DNA repair exonuclease SbcCD ATPase subunit